MMTIQEAWLIANNCNEYHVENNEFGITVDDEAKTVYFAIEGSDGKGFDGWKLTKDWASNFKFIKVYHGKFRVHKGFYESWQMIKPKVFELLIPYTTQGYKVVGVHFSRGCGTGSIAHEDIQYCLTSNIESIFIAMPRAWGWKNKKIIKERFKNCYTFRVNKDWVPRLPFKWMGFIDPCKIITLKAKYGFFKVTKNHMSYREF